MMENKKFKAIHTNNQIGEWYTVQHNADLKIKSPHYAYVHQQCVELIPDYMDGVDIVGWRLDFPEVFIVLCHSSNWT